MAGVVACAFLLAVEPTSAATKKISGKLSQPGFTVLALGTDGEATSKLAHANGKFKLRPPSKEVSLHLRAADGTYAGPIVIDKKGRNGKKAILGVEAGAELGKVRVRKGYAKLKDDLAPEDTDRTQKAKAKNGVPIGTGNFGRVAAKATGASGPGNDQDRDGIPGALDIDDDGDLVLDNTDQFTASSPSAQTARGPALPTEIFDVHTQLPLPIEFTANANAAGSTEQQIEAALPSQGRVLMEIIPGDSSELDCAGDALADPPRPGLVYCSSGGTGRVWAPGVQESDRPPFPECCDADGDGFGTMQHAGGPGPAMFLDHKATTAQIGTGDILIQRVTTGGVETQFPTALQFVFATTPALVSYGDEVGPETVVSYPVANGDPGTNQNGFPIEESGADADSDVELTMTFWRPQRRPIEDEACLVVVPACTWVDVGGLTYSANVNHIGAVVGGTDIQQPCPQSSYATTDPQLTLPPAHLNTAGFMDLAQDQPATPANTLTFTVNLSNCLSALGASLGSEQVGIDFFARVSTPGGADNAVQNAWFQPQ